MLAASCGAVDVVRCSIFVGEVKLSSKLLKHKLEGKQKLVFILCKDKLEKKIHFEKYNYKIRHENTNLKIHA